MYEPMAGRYATASARLGRFLEVSIQERPLEPAIPARHVYATAARLWHMQLTDEQPAADGRVSLASQCARLGPSVVVGGLHDLPAGLPQATPAQG